MVVVAIHWARAHQHDHPLNFKFGELCFCATVGLFGVKGALLVHRPQNNFQQSGTQEV